MIEAGEPLYNMIATGIMIFISFLVGIQVGSLKNEQKNTD